MNEEFEKWMDSVDFMVSQPTMRDVFYAGAAAMREKCAEGDQHHTKFNEWDKATNLLIKQLAVATEALKRIAEYKDQNNERECPYIARTALERIKE